MTSNMEYNFTIKPGERHFTISVGEYVKRRLISEIYNEVLTDELKKSFYKPVEILLDEVIIQETALKSSIIACIFHQTNGLIINTNKAIDAKVTLKEDETGINLKAELSYDNLTITPINIRIC